MPGSAAAPLYPTGTTRRRCSWIIRVVCELRLHNGSPRLTDLDEAMFDELQVGVAKLELQYCFESRPPASSAAAIQNVLSGVRAIPGSATPSRTSST